MTHSRIHFGTDGWRGIIGEDFTFDNLRLAAAATASYVKTHSELGDGSVLIGYDRRFLSRAFADEAARVLSGQGIRAKVSAQALPTPAVSFSVVHRKASWGIVITASHNPAIYNGFKIKDGHGRSAPPEVTREIEAHLSTSCMSSAGVSDSSFPAAVGGDSTPPLASGGAMDPRPVAAGDDEKGRAAGNDVIKFFDDRKAYERYLKARLDWKILRRYKATVVFDHLYGTASGIPERVLSGTPLRIHALHAQPDPLFGGLHPEPIESQLGDLRKEVRRRKARVGIAFDGDADRLGIVDEKGRYLTPHQVFPLLVLHCIEHKGWNGKVVQAVSLGYLSERIARAFNLPFEEVSVGFKHVAERMLQDNFMAGGEESGGYAVRGGLPERDGILNGLLFLEMLAARKQSPSQLLSAMEKRFGRARFKRIDILLDAPILDRPRFAQDVSSRLPHRLAGEKVSEVRTRDGVKVILHSGSWVLLRPSGTEPLIRTYAESESEAKTDALLHWAKGRMEGRG